MLEFHEGDCLDVLRGIESESFEALVTDPPFGIGFYYEGTREEHITHDAYWDWLRPRYLEALRCVKPGGFVAIWQSQVHFEHFWQWFGSEIHIYAAAKNFVQLKKTAINFGYDPVVMYYKKGAAPLRPDKPRRNIDFFVADTASIVRDTTRLERRHPCPRPLPQVQEILTNFVAPGGHVLDPFCGSGTVAVAAQALGMSCTSVDTTPAWIDLALARVGRKRRLDGE